MENLFVNCKIIIFRRKIFLKNIEGKMKKKKKDLPEGVPEENVYENTHILLYVFYAIAVASVVLLMVNQ